MKKNAPQSQNVQDAETRWPFQNDSKRTRLVSELILDVARYRQH